MGAHGVNARDGHKSMSSASQHGWEGLGRVGSEAQRGGQQAGGLPFLMPQPIAVTWPPQQVRPAVRGCAVNRCCMERPAQRAGGRLPHRPQRPRRPSPRHRPSASMRRRSGRASSGTAAPLHPRAPSLQAPHFRGWAPLERRWPERAACRTRRAALGPVAPAWGGAGAA